MKIGFQDESFFLLDIDYEMMQTILLGLDSERKRMNDKIAKISLLLHKNYTKQQKEDFKVQLAYIKEKQKNLSETINYCHSKIESFPI
jgi:hypothetical protein